MSALRRYLHLEYAAEQDEAADPREIEAAWSALSPGEVAWLRRRPPPRDGSTFEDEARNKKAMALCAVLVGDARAAARAPKMSQAERARVAARARCRPPSPATWRLVVDMLAL